MGLTDNQKKLIRSIAENNMPEAKKCAMACLAEDTTEKNKCFCKSYQNILQAPGTNLLEVPANLQNILLVEDVSKTFIEGRYFLSEREKQTYESIVRMNQVSQKLQEMKIPYLNSTILHGESGTGKTTFGRYLAYKLGLPFSYLNFSHAIDSYLGGTSKNVALAFNHATQHPCVFMLDEIDCISLKRGRSTDRGVDGEISRTTISLMQQLDRLPNSTILIAATNRIDRIDDAILRRFSKQAEIKPFSTEEKEQMIRQYLSDIPVEISESDIAFLAMQDYNQSRIINELINLIAIKIA